MILQIAGNLSGPDLLAFSGTNREFSNMLSHERRFWRKHLDEIKFPGARYSFKAPACFIIAQGLRFKPQTFLLTILFSNLSQTSEESANCQEKDEFLYQSCLRKNWRNGNFKLGETTQQMIGQWTLAYSYADFIVWHTTKGVNSWQLCCYDAGIGKFIFPEVTVPAQANMEDCTICKIQMATKSLAIVHLFDLNDQLWAVDISNPDEAATVWQSQLSLDNEVWITQVANGQVLLSKSANIPAIEIYDATNGSFITRVDFPIVAEPNMDFGFFYDGRRCNQEVGQELKMMPIYGKNDSPLFFLSLRDHQITIVNPAINMEWIEEYSFLGPTDFMVGNATTNTFKIISWKQDKFDVREVKPSSKQSNPGFALESIVPKGDLYAVKKNSSGTCISFSRFDHRGGETEIKIRPKNLKPRSTQLHFDTLISHSSFAQTRRLKFISFSPEGGMREVQKKPIQPSSLRRFKLEEKWCLTTAAVVKFGLRRGARKTVFAVLNFKPE